MIPKLKNSFESQGGKIGRVRIEGELLVRLTGEFNITRQEVAAFIKKFAAEGGKLSTINKDVVRLSNFSKAIERDMEVEAYKAREVPLSDGTQKCKFTRSVMQAGTDMTIKCGKGLNSHGGGAMFSGNDMFLSAREMEFDGFKIDVFKEETSITPNLDTVADTLGVDSEEGKISAGYMGVLYAKNDLFLSFPRYLSLQNALASSMNVISMREVIRLI